MERDIERELYLKEKRKTLVDMLRNKNKIDSYLRVRLKENNSTLHLYIKKKYFHSLVRMLPYITNSNRVLPLAKGITYMKPKYFKEIMGSKHKEHFLYIKMMIADKVIKKVNGNYYLNPCVISFREYIPIETVYLFFEELKEARMIDDEVISTLSDKEMMIGDMLYKGDEVNISFDIGNGIDETIITQVITEKEFETLRLTSNIKKSFVVNADHRKLIMQQWLKYTIYLRGKFYRSKKIYDREILKGYNDDDIVSLAVVQRDKLRGYSGKKDKIIAELLPLTKKFIVDNSNGKLLINVNYGELEYSFVDLVDLYTGEIIYQMNIGEYVKESIIRQMLESDYIYEDKGIVIEDKGGDLSG